MIVIVIVIEYGYLNYLNDFKKRKEKDDVFIDVLCILIKLDWYE